MSKFKVGDRVIYNRPHVSFGVYDIAPGEVLKVKTVTGFNDTYGEFEYFCLKEEDFGQYILESSLELASSDERYTEKLTLWREAYGAIFDYTRSFQLAAIDYAMAEGVYEVGDVALDIYPRESDLCLRFAKRYPTGGLFEHRDFIFQLEDIIPYLKKYERT